MSRIVKCGSWDNLYKMAMPVPVRPEEQSAMLGEGALLTTDPDLAETNKMPRVERGMKREIKALLGELSLPRIMYLTEKNVISVGGRTYYLLDVKEPQVKANPTGTLILFDPDARSIVKLPYDQHAEEIQAVRQEVARPIIEKMKKWVPRWNRIVEQVTGEGAEGDAPERVSSAVRKILSPTTWPLFLATVEDITSERIADLDSMISALKAQRTQQEQPSAAYGDMISRLESDLREGSIPSSADQIDTASWIYFNDAARGKALIEDQSVPFAPGVREKLNSLIGMHAAEIKSQEQERARKKTEKEQRMQGAATDYGSPELSRLEMPEIKGDLPKPDKYVTPEDRLRQTKAKLTGSQENLELLVPIREGLANLRSFVAGLEDKSDAFFASDSPESERTRQAIRQFNNMFKQFRKSYEAEIFRQNKDTGQYVFNTSLLGTTGPGNAAVGSLLNSVITVIDLMLAKTTPMPQDLGELVPEHAQSGVVG